MKQGQDVVDGRTMEFIDAETRTPTSDAQVWEVVDEKLVTSYASRYEPSESMSSQACTSRRAIDNTDNFFIKSGKEYNFLSGFSIFESLTSTEPTSAGDSAALTFTLDSAQSGLTTLVSLMVALTVFIY